MSKRLVTWLVKCWRGVDWNPKAVAKRLTKGSLWMGPKVDGVRAHIRATDVDVIELVSRAGKPFPALDGNALAYIASLINVDVLYRSSRALDCELWLNHLPMEKANGRLSEHAPLTDAELIELRLMCFDVPSKRQLEGAEESTLSLHERRAFATCILHHDCQQFRLEVLSEVHSLDDIERMYECYRMQGWEGGMVKDHELPYRNGKVSGIWKRKPKITVDGMITGYVWGEVGKANEGKIVGFEIELENGASIRATGLSQKFIESLTDNYDAGVGSPIGRQCEVTAMEYTSSGALRHPNFHRFRDLESDPGVKV